MQLGARSSATLLTDSGIHPTTYTIFTGSFVKGKAARTWRKTLAPSSAVVKERVQLYIYISLVLHGYSRTPLHFIQLVKP